MKHFVLINSDKMEPIQLLASNCSVDFTVITKPKYACLYKELAPVFQVSDVADVTEASLAVLEILKTKDIDGIICPLERSILTGGYLRSHHSLPGLTYEQSLGFANKLIMKQRLNASSLPVTEFTRLDRLDDLPAVAQHLGWPIIVKPAIGSGSMNTLVIKSKDHFVDLENLGLLKKLEEVDVPLIAERFVDIQNEYHCDSIVANEEVIFSSTSQYIKPVLSSFGGMIGSYILSDQSSKVKEINRLNKRVIEALNLREGVTHLEVYETTDNSFVVGEITCRPGGGGIVENIERHTGISIWKAFIQIALGDYPKFDKSNKTQLSGWVGLPSRNGLVTQLTSVEELYEIPGVDNVQMNYSLGEKINEKQTSVSYAGKIFFSLKTEEDIPTFLKNIQEKYSLEVSVG